MTLPPQEQTPAVPTNHSGTIPGAPAQNAAPSAFTPSFQVFRFLIIPSTLAPSQFPAGNPPASSPASGTPATTAPATSGTGPAAGPQGTGGNPVEVSNILGNNLVQQTQQGNTGTGGTLPLGPTAGPSGAIGAGGMPSQGPILIGSNLILGQQVGTGSTVAPLTSAPTAPPAQVIVPATLGPLPESFAVPVPEGGGNGLTGAEDREQPENPPDDGDTLPGQPDQNPEQVQLRLLEALSPLTVIDGTQQGAASAADGSFWGAISPDGTGSLLETDLSLQQGRRIDFFSGLTAIAVGLLQVTDTEQDLARDGKGPAGKRRKQP